MSKPIQDMEITTLEGGSAHFKVVLDRGSYYTIVRQDRLPKEAAIWLFKEPRILGTAAKGGKLTAVGLLHLQIKLAGHEIEDEAFVSPELNQDMLLGAKTMQAWDISVKNKNGHTEILVGRDMHDPDIQEVD